MNYNTNYVQHHAPLLPVTNADLRQSNHRTFGKTKPVYKIIAALFIIAGIIGSINQISVSTSNARTLASQAKANEIHARLGPQELQRQVKIAMERHFPQFDDDAWIEQFAKDANNFTAERKSYHEAGKKLQFDDDWHFFPTADAIIRMKAKAAAAAAAEVTPAAHLAYHLEPEAKPWLWDYLYTMDMQISWIQKKKMSIIKEILKSRPDHRSYMQSAVDEAIKKCMHDHLQEHDWIRDQHHDYAITITESGKAKVEKHFPGYIQKKRTLAWRKNEGADVGFDADALIEGADDGGRFGIAT